VVATVPAVSAAETRIVSVDSSGGQGNGDSVAPAVSDDDGRFVAFVSYASNLVAGDTNGVADVFVRDLLLRRTERVSVSGAGRQADGPSDGRVAISADGRFVAFASRASNLVSTDRNGLADVFVRDRDSGKTERISIDRWGGDPNGASGSPDISADGRSVVFASSAGDIASKDTNGVADVFVRDRDARVTQVASADRWGGQANGESGEPDLSPDGRFVAFDSLASDLAAGGNWAHAAFVRDLVTSTSRLAGGPTDVSTDPAVGDDGGVAYVIGGVPRQIVLSWSPYTSVLWLTLGANGDAFNPELGGRSAQVAFESTATNLSRTPVPGQVFRRWGEPRVVSTSTDGLRADGVSRSPSVSPDGSSIAFDSVATNLVPGDLNGAADVFVNLPPVSCHGRTPTIVGTEGPDVLYGTENPDVIVGLGGDDVIHGGKNDDVICGDGGLSSGNDTVEGDSGADILDGQRGRDIVNGNTGADDVSGGEDADQVRGGDGADTLRGGDGGDVLNGGTGPDVMLGGAGGDLADYRSRTAGVEVSLDGQADDGEPGEGDDVGGDVERLRGGDGADRLTGNDGANTIYGGPGGDELIGEHGHDRLYGDAGGDTIDSRDDESDDVFCGTEIDSVLEDALDLLDLDCEE